MTHLAHHGPQHAPRTLAGIGLFIASIAVFTVQDLVTTHLARNYPVPFFLMLRYWAFASFAIAFASADRAGLAANARARRPFLQIARGLLLVSEMGLFALGLRYLQLGEMHALFAANPLIVTALSALFLGEIVRWRRWLAVFAGFIGVLVILRPGLGVMQPAALLGLTCAAFFATYTVMTKLASRTDPFATTFLYTALFGALVVSSVGVFNWTTVAPFDWLLIASLCATGIIGHFMVIKALEYAPASVLQPFSYLQLVGAATAGYLVLGEVPDRMTFIGAAIIVASGLYIVWRERQIKTQ